MRNLVVGIIIDGNRTYAWRKSRLHADHAPDFAAAYRRGARECVRVIKNSPKLGIGRLVFYALSHWDIKNRPAGWLKIWEAGAKEFCRLLPQLGLKVQVNCYGSFKSAAIDQLVRCHRRPDGLIVDLLVGYSAEWDLQTRPIRTATIPELDFVVRTHEGKRLSGFLPLQANYAELYFYSGLWPSSGYRAVCAAVARYRKYEKEMKKKGERGA